MRIRLLLSLFVLFFSSTPHAVEKLIQTSSQEEIPVTVFNVDYKADKNTPVLLWLPTEYGIHGREAATAEALAQKGIEVWIADLHSAFFLPFGRSSYNNIQDNDIVELIKTASNNEQREVILFATGRAAPIALRAVRELQAHQSTKNIVKSAILFHPNFYMNTVNVGDDINYQPITYATNLALYIVQPSLSGKSYQLKTLTRHLQKGGSDVMSQILSGVGDGFNIRKPDNEIEKQAYLKTSSIIFKATQLLKHFKKKDMQRNSQKQQQTNHQASLMPACKHTREQLKSFTWTSMTERISTIHYQLIKEKYYCLISGQAGAHLA